MSSNTERHAVCGPAMAQDASCRPHIADACFNPWSLCDVWDKASLECFLSSLSLSLSLSLNQCTILIHSSVTESHNLITWQSL
jgi:hypothetical protein